MRIINGLLSAIALTFFTTSAATATTQNQALAVVSAPAQTVSNPIPEKVSAFDACLLALVAMSLVQRHSTKNTYRAAFSAQYRKPRLHQQEPPLKCSEIPCTQHRKYYEEIT